LKSVSAGSLAITFVALMVTEYTTAGSFSAHTRNDAPDSEVGIFHVSDARGPIRQVDSSPLANRVPSEVLAGPTNGLDSAYVIYTRIIWH